MQTNIQIPSPEEFTLIERVARIVSSMRGARPDYAHLAAELAPVIPFDVFGIVLLRHDRQAVRVNVCTREEEGWKAHYHQHPLADSMLEQLLLQGTPVDTEQLPDTTTPVSLYLDSVTGMVVCNYPTGLDGSPAESGDALSGNPQLHSTLIVPLAVRDRILGSLELGSIRSKAYDDERVQRLIGVVARVLAAAIESAQVGGSVEIQDRQRQELKEVTSALTSKMDLSMILKRVAVGITNALHVASAIIIYDSQKSRLRLEAQQGIEAEPLRHFISQKGVLSSGCIIGYSLKHRQPCISNDILQDERFPVCQTFAAQHNMRSVFCYPLVADTQVFGVILLLSPEPGGFTPLKADILSLFASQATIAIRTSMLLEAARKRQRFQKALEQLEKSSHVSIPEQDELALLKRVQEETEQTFGISFNSLLRFISDHLLAGSERDWQSILQALDEPSVIGLQGEPPPLIENALVEPRTGFVEDGSDLLIQTAEAALNRADFIDHVGTAFSLDTSEISSLDTTIIPQFYERMARDMQDSWFIVDLQGRCIYLNPAAKIFCGTQLDTAGTVSMVSQLLTPRADQILRHTPPLTLCDALAGVVARARQPDEVQSFLDDFTSVQQPVRSSSLATAGQEQSGASRPQTAPLYTLRCAVAADPVSEGDQTATREHMHSLGRSAGLSFPDNAPSDHYFQFIRHPLYNADGQLIANALQVHDVTAQVRDERNKSVLLSSVSHDLRTPLTAIKAAVSGLLQPGVEWDDKTYREMLEDIDAEADHLHLLINSMVEMSRIEMGALVLEKEWCDLVEIVHSTLSRAGRVLEDHKLHLDFEPNLPLIYVDYLQMKRVFHNLLENAARHSPPASEILLTAHSTGSSTTPGRGEEGGFIRVQVIDHGRGVPEEERERIFKTFYSLDPHRSGLGLAICRGIIEAHHGRIWVESAPDGGACFVFVLPVSS
ncbi:MAG TPA: ATP-binding protein [Ktedonobacteraceae bacterium]|jgi:signal transduction histidine kinase/GAF domain-containing protein|nr:ATP-binding protein [Ktedonobacteraceae bacterium]